MNEQNLIPFTSDQSREEAVKNGKLGGLRSAEARRERQRLRRELETLLDAPMPKHEDKTIQTAIATALVKAALNGSVRAFEVIRDTIGEKPMTTVTMNTEPDFSALDAAFNAMRERNDNHVPSE